MDLQPRFEQITVAKEFLHSTAGLTYKVGNVTLKASAFPKGNLKGGTLVMKGADGLFIPYVASAGTTPVAGVVYAIANDITIGERNVQVGAIEKAYLKASNYTAAINARLPLDSEYRLLVR